MMERYTIYAYGKTDRGQVLEVNDDATHLEQMGPYYVMIIADGQNGCKGMASIGKIATTLMADYLRKIIKPDTSIQEIKNQMDGGLYLCSQCYLTLNAVDERYAGIYSSLSVLILNKDTLQMVMASVGNTEIQLYRDKQFSRLSEVHSEAFDELMKGILMEEEFYISPKRGLVTSALGSIPITKMDIRSGTLRQGDIIFLVTDGIFRHVTPNEILQCCYKAGSIDSGIDAALVLGNERGGLDNMTIIGCVISDD